MSDAENKLNELSDFFRRMSAKVKLIKLIEHAKIEYDKYNLDSSLESLEKAYKIDSGDATTLLVLGDLSYRTADYKTALKYYKNAESHNKTTTSICSVKVAQTYEMLGKEKRAVDIYEKVLKTYSDSWVAYYKIALKDKSK